ncbi:MAG: carboxypeptidase-like regulatory domain-containing protein [Acidobacteriaceae bacterium]
MLFVSILFSSAAFAQNDVGTIVGYVTDPSGAVIANAKVTATNEGTKSARTVTTDAQGHYAFPNLPPAPYTVKITAPGFKEFDSTANTLPTNTTIDIDAKLQVGAQSETVNVSGTAAVLQTQSAAVQAEVTGKRIQLQELNGRNPVYMAQYLPGVASGATISDFNFSFNSGDTFNINGARTQDTEYFIDGAPAVRTRDDGEMIAGANTDAVQEMQVMTADYSAEYGGASGAQVRIVTKSGTTDFHGSLYEYLRNSAMNANTWGRNLNPLTRHITTPFRYNNFGFSIGGPVWAPKVPVLDRLRNTFFFFINEDWVRYRQTTTTSQTEPTARMRGQNNGNTGADFSELLVTNPYYAAGTKIYEPGTCPTAGAPTCVAYPGNFIPASQLSPNGMAIINSSPVPIPGYQNGANNWEGNAPNPINQRKGQINGDLLTSPNNHILFRRSDDSFTSVNPFNEGNDLVPTIQPRPNQINALGWTWTISPTMINEAHFSVSIDDVYTNQQPGGLGLNRSSVGGRAITPYSPNGINFNYIIPGPKSVENKIPTVNVPIFANINGGPYPSTSSGIIYAGTDSWTKVWGNHTIKAGIFFDYMGENDNDQINVSTVPGGASNQNGTFFLSDTGIGSGTTGVGEANLAVGHADSYTEIGTRAFTVWRGKLFEEFAQDNWQVTPKLNFDYGLRVSTLLPPYAQWGNADYFDAASYNPANAVTINSAGLVVLGSGNAYNGVVIPGFSSFPSIAAQHNVLAAETGPQADICAGKPCTGLFAPNLRKGFVIKTTTWQPRIGFAYQIYPKTVVRGGIGRFVENKGIIDNVFPGGNSPFQPEESVNNVSVDNPGASITTAVEPPITFTSMSQNMFPPTRVNWNVAVQQQLPWHSTGTIAYVGAAGRHNWQAHDVNQAPVGSLTNPANAGVPLAALRPYKGFNFIDLEYSGANEAYESLQMSYQKQFGQGSEVGASYTWGKEMDSGSNYHTIVPDTYDTSNLWGPSEFDKRNVLTLNFLYTLPFWSVQNTIPSKLLGGWQFSGSAQAQSGTPCSIGEGSSNDYAGVGETGSFNCNTSVGQFWVQNAPISEPRKFAGPNGTPSSPKWFNTTSGGAAIWTAPARGTFNLQKNIRDNVYSPGINLKMWNLALIKTFLVYKANEFQFRAEAYDVLNYAPLGGANYTPTSSQFGEVTGKNGNSRNLQVGLRYQF